MIQNISASFLVRVSESLLFFCSYSRGVMSPERHVRTRLYFTSESHVHSLLSILRYGALCDVSHTTHHPHESSSLSPHCAYSSEMSYVQAVRFRFRPMIQFPPHFHVTWDW